MPQKIIVLPGHRVVTRCLEDGSMELTIKPPGFDGNLLALAGRSTAPSGPYILMNRPRFVSIPLRLTFCRIVGRAFDLYSLSQRITGLYPELVLSAHHLDAPGSKQSHQIRHVHREIEFISH